MRQLKPVLLAMLALLGIVVAGNFPPDSAEAFPRRINVCVSNEFFLYYSRSCGDSYQMSWPAARPFIAFGCMVKRNRQIGLTPVPPRCGPLSKRLIWGGYSETTKYLTVCVDRRSRKMFVAVRGKCGARLKIRWVKSAPYLPIESTTTTVAETTTTSTTSSSTTTTTIVPSCANGLAECLYGDTGPGGGKVFYVDLEEEFDWDYLEAAPDDWNSPLIEMISWTCEAEYGTPTATGREIGDGRSNTLSMRNATTDCAAGSLAAGQVIPDLVYGGKSDWFVPSIGELQEMASQNTALGLELSANVYWSSTQSTIQDDYAVAYDLDTNSELNTAKGLGLVRPIRAFGPDCAWGGVCELGDIGPGGGRVFYIDSADEFADWTYMEIAQSNWYGGSELTGTWCSNDTSTEFGATAYGIGSGVTNFAIMTANCTGIADTVDDYGSEYLGLRLDDWFIPSDDEMNAAYSVINGLGFWSGFSQWAYWTSTEFYNNARVLLSSGGYTAATLKDAGNTGVIPIRAF